MSKVKTAGYVQEIVEQEKLALKRLEANSAAVSKLEIDAFKTYLGYHENILKAVADGKTIVFATFGFTPEIFEAMDIQPVLIGDFFRVMARFRLNGLLDTIDLAANQWLPDTTCPFMKGTVGAILAGKFISPDLIISGSHPCDAGIAGINVIQELVKVPTFNFEIPRWENDRTLDYMCAETKRMVSFLEEHTGKKLDIDRLREVAEESNRAEELNFEINELRRAVPCPQPGKFLRAANTARMFLQGLPAASALLREILADSTERVRRGVGALPKEKMRVIWYDLATVYFDFYGWLEREWEAVVVMDLLSYQPVSYIDTSGYEGMIRGFAGKILNEAMVRTVHRGLVDCYIDEFVRVYEDYKADCAIVAGHGADKQRPALTSILRDICREKSIPLLVLTYDYVDPRAVSAESICAKIEQFFTTVVLR
jgi:benzoyl-CoA reductase subunit B